MSAPTDEITRLLASWSAGDDAAFDRLIELVYADLRQIAHKHLRAQRSDHTLGTTALVHEAYLRLCDSAADVDERARFYAFVSRTMRHILIDYARSRGAVKRGGGAIRIPLSEMAQAEEARGVELLELDRALTRLEERDARLARVVECRFFGGMTVEETARALGVSLRTVERDWTRARAYLWRDLNPPPGTPSPPGMPKE